MNALKQVESLRCELVETRERTEKAKMLLRKALKELQGELRSEHYRKEPGELEEKKELEKRIREAVAGAEADLSQSRFLQLTLGASEFKLPEKQKFRYKSDYEKFKLFAALVVSCMTLASLLVFNRKVLDTLQILGYMYIYATITMREHILLNNGSSIKAWWIVHHYMCITLAGVNLTCPHEVFEKIRRPLLLFLFLLSCAQAVQYQYQMKRLYILRSLKRAHPLETTNEMVSGTLAANLGVAVILLFAFQAVQLYVSYYIYVLHRKNGWVQYQPLVSAILLGAMATGNIITTTYTCYTKIEKKKRTKKE